MTSETARQDDEAVWAKGIVNEFATRAGGDYLEQMGLARMMLEAVVQAVNSGELPIFIRGLSGRMIERVARAAEPSFPVGDYLLKRSTVEVWFDRRCAEENARDTMTPTPETIAQPSPDSVTTQPLPMEKAWQVRRPMRFGGYAAPLHSLLREAHRADKPRPTARDVLEAWRVNQPAEVAKVLPESIDYYDSKGGTKTAAFEAIRKAIARMTAAQ